MSRRVAGLCLVVLLGVSAACSAGDTRPPGLVPLDPLHRPTSGEISTDRTGDLAVALPAGRPLREISLYDFSSAQVVRFEDSEVDARYDNDDVVLSRDGKEIIAIRRFIKINRYPQILSINVESGATRILNSNAEAIASPSAGADGRNIYFFRNLDDRLPDDVVERVGPDVEISLRGTFQKLVRIPIDGTSEEPVANVILEQPIRVSNTLSSIYVVARGVHPALLPVTSSRLKDEAAAKYSGGGYAGPLPLPYDYDPSAFYLFEVPQGASGRAHLRDMRRLSASDFKLTAEKVSFGGSPAALSANSDLLKNLGLEGDGNASHLRPQLSDDERSYFQLNDDATCWGDGHQPRTVDCEPHALNGPTRTWLRAAMSPDGRSVLLGHATRDAGAPEDSSEVRRWCRLSFRDAVRQCVWRSENDFVEVSRPLIPTR